MGHIRTILVPVDFSDPARLALEEAIALGKKLGAELHLLHCYPLIVPSTFSLYKLEVPRTFEDDVRMVREAAQRRMTQWSRRIGAAAVPVREHLAANLPSAEIADVARKIGADLIVMGTRGLSGLEHVLLGSVAERTVRTAPCPVLTVGMRDAKDRATRESNLPQKEIAVKEIHKILVPVDFSEHSQRALDEAIAFATTFGAEVHLLHSYQIHPQAIAPYGIVVPETYEHDVRMAALRQLAEWRDKVSAAGCKVQEHLTAHFPSEAIAEMAERLKVDLIVMGTRGLTGLKHVLLGSVAERTIRTAPCPVLTVKHTGAR
jgi:nucleotide-binding universal stress UspA family protein